MIALGISFSILYLRKEEWIRAPRVWLFCLALSTIGIASFLYFAESASRDERIMYWGFCVPFIYWTSDRFFKKLSVKIHQRDFILFLRGSKEIDDSISALNPLVEVSDKIISILLVLIIVLTLLLGIQLI